MARSLGIKDALLVLDEVKEFGKAQATADVAGRVVTIHFHLPDPVCPQTGQVRLRCVDEAEFNRRIVAAAKAVTAGDDMPRGIDDALPVLARGIRPQALRILTNPKVWTIENIKSEVVAA